MTNNFEIHDKAIELIDTMTPYALARRIIELDGMRNDAIKEAFENGYHYATEGSYPDITYSENVDQAYSEWVDVKRIERGEL